MFLFADEEMSPVAFGTEKRTRIPVTVERLITRNSFYGTHLDGSKGK
jgi:hypothetical protein